MVAVTYGVARVPATAPAARAKTAAPGKSWFARFMDALAARAHGAGEARNQDAHGLAALQLG